MGGGGGKGSGGNRETNQLGLMANQLFAETAPMRKTILDQGMEALKTGGIGAQIPVIARALESSKSQLSQDLQSTQDLLASRRLAGTPFGAGIMSQARIGGNQAIANIPTGMASNFISMMPSFVSALTGQGVGGAGQASQSATGIQQSNIAGNTATTNALMGTASTAAMVAVMM